MGIPTDHYDGEERRANGGRRDDDFSPRQRQILKRMADNQDFWDELKIRLAAKGKWWAFVGTSIAGVLAGWAALKGLGIDITFKKEGQ
jgi:hypothetical protein